MTDDKKKSLYGITKEHYEIMNALQESEGEITPEIEEMMKINDEEFETKVEGYVNFIRKLEADIAEAKALEARVKSVRASDQSLVERLKGNLEDAMNVRQAKEYKGSTFRISFRKSSPLVLDPDQTVPKKYIKKMPKIDKAAIKAALKAGKKVRGASIGTNYNIQIK